MKKIITYGTYDLLHFGHIQLLKRARELGDYLIVGVTSDDFDRSRGKINVRQSLMERIEAVRQTGLADEIIVEEYEGQKIDDIRQYGIDIFTVGSDWEGKFDYLKEFCDVVYLGRTSGVSSSLLRSKENLINIGLAGNMPYLRKFINESKYINGVTVNGIYNKNKKEISDDFLKEITFTTDSFEELLDHSDAVYIVTPPQEHYSQIKKALNMGKHVLCESPICFSPEECKELFKIADKKNLILFDSIKTAFSTAYYRMILLAKSGKIGNIVSIDSTCTSLRNHESADNNKILNCWNSISAWGPTAMLPIFQLLGSEFKRADIYCLMGNEEFNYDNFTKIAFLYSNAVASIKVGQGVKSEGELIISGTKGYIYVPAPWWKTDYFELRYENQNDNKRYFYQLEGEGIRNEILSFVRAIEHKSHITVNRKESIAFCKIMQRIRDGKDIYYLESK